MAEFLTTRGTSFYIENIIINAKVRLILVSPFLQLSKTLFERLKDASNRKVNIVIVYGKDELKANEKASLAELKNLKLYFHENLHAKCYFNDSEMVITSMNMYQFSEQNNREMGVFINAIADKELFSKAVIEVQSIITNSKLVFLEQPGLREKAFYNQQYASSSYDRKSYKSGPPQTGYCLRCEDRIPYNPDKPYCYDCYTVWAAYENPDYKENVCHCCGSQFFASMSRPLCNSCFEKFPFH